MIDHTGVSVSDLANAARRSTRAALAPLGYALIMAFERGRGLRRAAQAGLLDRRRQTRRCPRSHVAFRARVRARRSTRFTARRSHAGGRDNGAPGLRAHYHPNYYGAFVLDPDGHNIEAVCHPPG